MLERALRIVCAGGLRKMSQLNLFVATALLP